MGKSGKIMFIGGLLFVGLIILLSQIVKPNVISRAEVKNIIVKDMDIKEEDIHFENIDLSVADGFYEVDFYLDKEGYSYKINCKNGKIIYKNYPKEETTTTTKKVITLEEAKKIALKDADIKEKDCTSMNVKKDTYKKKEIYVVEFSTKKKDYSYKIDLETGKVL